jgi:hemoglobin
MREVMKGPITGMALGLLLAGCGEMTPAPSGQAGSSSQAAMAQPAKPRDGELALPGNYMVWPKFLSEVQRADVKQVRELYINHIGTKTSAGQPFPNGTLMVMELYKAKMNGETLASGPDGKLVKGDLTKIFVMGKGDGWGQDVSDNLKNGNWVFSAFGPDGKPLAEDFAKCRACHAPLAQKDFVHRYDEYFDARMKR